MTAHDANTIANEFIRLGMGANRPFTPMQLIKLVYLAHGWMLALFGRPLVRQRIEAWKYGPVIRSLYSDLRHYGNGSVTAPIVSHDDDALDREERHVIEQVFKRYGSASGIALSNMTHAPGSPWDEVWKSDGQNAEIPDHLMAAYFGQLADDARRRAAAARSA